jgi:putative spermidine/putrescine transport system permease protein
VKTRVLGPLVALLPALVVVFLLLIGGVAVTLTQAVMTGLGDGGMFTLEHFHYVFTKPGFLASLGLTLWVSVISTLLTLAFAVLTALSLRRMKRFQGLVTYIYQLPLTLPHLVLAAAGLMLLSQSGILARALAGVGWLEQPSQFPELVYDRGGIAIILVYVWKQIPFVGLFALAVLQSVGEDFEAAARTLGARPSQAIRHVLIPLVAPGLLPSGIIIFAFVFGAFEVPLLLGARYPSMLSVLAYRLYTDVDIMLRPQAMALSFSISAIVFVLVGAYRSLSAARGWA